jgi:hypothetical protein
MTHNPGLNVYKRVSTAWRLFCSIEFREHLAENNGGRALSDKEVCEYLEGEYFTDLALLGCPLQTLFAMYQAVPDKAEWGPDWPKLPDIPKLTTCISEADSTASFREMSLNSSRQSAV